MAARLWDRRAVGAAFAGVTLAGPARAWAEGQTPPLQPVPHADADMLAGADPSGRITVQVLVEGQGPFDFVVDTGANRSVIAADLAARLGLPDEGSANIHGIAGVEPARTVRVREIAMGQVVSQDLRCPVLGRDRLGADGLLGVDVLHNRHVMFDFEARQVRIRRSGAAAGRASGDRRYAAAGPAAAGVVVVPAKFRFGQLIIIDAAIDGRPIVCFLDTGSDSTVGNLALRRLVAAAAPSPTRMVVQLFSATGQTAQGEVLPLPPLKLGGLRMDRLEAVFADLHVFALWKLLDRPTLLIGIDILRHFDGVAVDYGRREVSFLLPRAWRQG